MPNNPKFIVLHHTAILGATRQFDQVNEAHRRRGFPQSRLGFYGGYHRLIEPSGKVMTYREDDEVGAHTVSSWPSYWNMNAKSIGICLAGDFTREKVSMDQLRSLRSLLDYYQPKYGITGDRVLLHRETKATACPGVDLMYLVENLVVPDYVRQLATAETEFAEATGMRKRILGRMIPRLKKLIDESNLSGLAGGLGE